MNQEKKMTVQELVDYITSKMDAREALEKILASQVSSYEKLKNRIFSEKGESLVDEEASDISPLVIISAAALELGWGLAIENDSEENQGKLRGLVIGTEDYMRHILEEKKNLNDEYEHFTNEEGVKDTND